MPKIKRKITIACLFCILLIGLTVRLEDLRDWPKQPEISFFKGEPLLTTIDGYYYLRLARDLVEGKYHFVDTLRTYPESPNRPFSPPLLSVLAATISKLGHLSLNWVGVLLPAFLGIMVMAPVFAIGRFYGGTSMGLTASLLVVLSYSYLTRSALGWFDTDCLNVFFTMAGIYCCIQFSFLQSRKRYFYFLGFLINYGLFIWWWDSTPQAVTAISVIPLLISLVFFYRPEKKEGVLFYGTLALLCALTLYWKGFNLPVRIAENLAETLHYISKQGNTFFPNVSQLVLEQRKAGLQEFIDGTVHSEVAFFLAVIGFGTLIIRQPGKSLFLLAPAILSVMPLLFSQRFIIFAAPIISLGFGYYVSLLWQFKNENPKTVVLAPLLVLVLAAINFQTDIAKNFWTFNVGSVVTGMNFIEQNTPKNAIVFARWSVGYPCQYWTHRPTVADGAFHGGERSVYNAIPPAVKSDKLAANFINFLVRRGMAGFATVYKAVNNDKDKGLKLIKTVLKAGPAESYAILKKAQLRPNQTLQTIHAWQQFFFPKVKQPIYWFFDYEMAETTYWWFWLGTWDIARADGRHPRFRSFLNVRSNDKYLGNGKDISGSLVDGTITTSVRSVKIQAAEMIYDYGKTHTIKYPVTSENQGIFFSLFIPGQFAALQDSTIHDSVFSRLFIRHQESAYFIPVKLQTPAYQIYQVKPESLSIR